MKKKFYAMLLLGLALCLCFALVACGTHECKDTNRNHKCDVCDEPMGEHIDGEDGNHLCDNGCGKVADSGCHDAEKDGICDECGETIQHTCKDENRDHACDVCSKTMAHADGNDSDKLCDYGCGKMISWVYVTIAKQGALVLTREKVIAADNNDDGKIDIDEVLFAAHEAKYAGGAAAGYASYTGDYGLSLGMLWGDASGAFAYYVDHASAWSLADEVVSGAYVYAFVYQDTETWSDSYSFFQMDTDEVYENSEIELILQCAGYDENWNPITLPVAGAVITVDGVATNYVTGADGKVILKLDGIGDFMISAISTDKVLAPPVCKIFVIAN